MVNGRINIPWVPESVELTIFEHAIAIVGQVLQDTLPESFGELLRHDSTGIDPAQAEALGARLVDALNQKVNLPYFDEEQEREFLQAAVQPLVQALSDGDKIDAVLSGVKSEVAESLAVDK